MERARRKDTLLGSRWAWIGVFATALVFTSACSRSKNYQEDKNFYTEQPRSYYSQPQNGQSPTQRLERLGQPKKRVFVLDFHNSTPVDDRTLGAFAADEMRRGLFIGRRVLVPTDVKTQFQTTDFLDEDRVRVAQLIREGRRLGVAVLGIGRIAKVVFRQRGDDVGILKQTQSLAAVDLEIKLFDVASGRELMAIGRSGEAASNALTALEGRDLSAKRFRSELSRLAIRDAIAQLVPHVAKSVEKLTWEGRIAKIDGRKVYLNSGRTSGLVNGDILRVLTKGDDVYDPESGAFLGRTQGQLKGTIEVVNFLSGDAAVASVHTGGNFNEGDVVRLY